MWATVHPGGFEGGRAGVPGDKSIAHRWLILAATARGRSVLRNLPSALDVHATARCLAALVDDGPRAALEAWARDSRPEPNRDRSTTNDPRPRGGELVLETEGRAGLHPPSGRLDCANSGSTMRMLTGLLAAAPFETVLEGDESLSRRPMERVAEPLRAMGAEVATTDGHAPVVVRGGRLHGIDHATAVPSAQVKTAVLLAGLSAAGETTVREEAPTRDHTERALAHLGAPISTGPGRVTVRAFELGGFEAAVPGDVSSAAFLVGAAVLTGTRLAIEGVGLNPTRTYYLRVLERMGATIRTRVDGRELGEPVGHLEVEPCSGLMATEVEAFELPLVIDEVPLLAIVATQARGRTRFAGAAELKVKESDRLGGVVQAISGLGGAAWSDGEAITVEGAGLEGGSARAHADHRLAMAIAVGGLAARRPVTVEGIEAAAVSFPGFVASLSVLGARIEAAT